MSGNATKDLRGGERGTDENFLLFPCIPQQEISKSEIKNKIAKINDSEVYVMNPDPQS
jgi:hypothetical protein